MLFFSQPFGGQPSPKGAWLFPVEIVMTRAKTSSIVKHLNKLIEKWQNTHLNKEMADQAIVTAMIIVRHLQEEDGSRVAYRKVKEMVETASLRDLFGQQWFDKPLMKAIKKAF